MLQGNLNKTRTMSINGVMCFARLYIIEHAENYSYKSLSAQEHPRFVGLIKLAIVLTVIYFCVQIMQM